MSSPIFKRKLICEAVYAVTEQHRHECEVRMVLKMNSRMQRKGYLDGVEARRGKVAADLLRVDVLRGWRNGDSGVLQRI